MIPAAVVGLVAGAIACRRPVVRPEPTPALRLRITSERSEYAPVLRADVTLQVRPDSLVVAVDSGFVLAPGRTAPGAPAVMRALRIRAVLAVPRAAGTASEATAETSAADAPWTAIAESAAQPLADSLQFGGVAPFGARRFALAAPRGGAPARAFVLFRVDGDAVQVQFRGRIRVYACAGETVRGAVDAERAARLRASYTAAC